MMICYNTNNLSTNCVHNPVWGYAQYSGYIFFRNRFSKDVFSRERYRNLKISSPRACDSVRKPISSKIFGALRAPISLFRLPGRASARHAYKQINLVQPYENRKHRAVLILSIGWIKHAILFKLTQLSLSASADKIKK